MLNEIRLIIQIKQDLGAEFYELFVSLLELSLDFGDTIVELFPNGVKTRVDFILNTLNYIYFAFFFLLVTRHHKYQCFEWIMLAVELEDFLTQ